jgi:hypothetical protein
MVDEPKEVTLDELTLRYSGGRQGSPPFLWWGGRMATHVALFESASSDETGWRFTRTGLSSGTVDLHSRKPPQAAPVGPGSQILCPEDLRGSYFVGEDRRRWEAACYARLQGPTRAAPVLDRRGPEEVSLEELLKRCYGGTTGPTPVHSWACGKERATHAVLLEVDPTRRFPQHVTKFFPGIPTFLMPADALLHQIEPVGPGTRLKSMRYVVEFSRGGCLWVPTCFATFPEESRLAKETSFGQLLAVYFGDVGATDPGAREAVLAVARRTGDLPFSPATHIAIFRAPGSPKRGTLVGIGPSHSFKSPADLKDASLAESGSEGREYPVFYAEAPGDAG